MESMPHTLLVVLLTTVLIPSTYCNTITCDTDQQCASSTITCNENESCNIYCTARSACISNTIECPSGSYNCMVYCLGWNACSSSYINANRTYGAHLIVDGDKDWALGAAKIYCPIEGDCNVTCAVDNPSYAACASTEIYAQQANRLYLDAGKGGTYMLKWTKVYCPHSFVSSANTCDILIRKTQYLNQMQGMMIYAIQSFNDVSISCLSTSACYPVDAPPFMYCTEGYTESCAMNLAADEWQCANDADVCNDYVLTTTSTSDPYQYISASYGNTSFITFGFVTSDVFHAITSDTVTVTLYWAESVYQCNVAPTQYSTYYACDTSNNETTTECDTSSIATPIAYGLQIDLENFDDVEIDKVIIQTMDNGQSTIYITDYFCFNHSSTNSGDVSSNIVTDHCVAAEYGGYDTIAVDYSDTYQSQIIIIDHTSSANRESFVHVNDVDDDHFSYVCVAINSCIDAIVTAMYGTGGFNVKNVDFNQGRVYEISAWGVVDYAAYPGIANFRWLSDAQTTFNDDYGWAGNDIIEACPSYTLADDEYINGYTVVSNDATIRGITFYTNTNKILQCVSNDLPDGTTTSGVITYPNRYLSGFYVGSGLIIDKIAFQFTAINNTNECHSNEFDNSTNVIIQNHKDSQKWWVAFNMSNVDVSCGASIVKVEISDDNNYNNVWLAYNRDMSQYGVYAFENTGASFTVPLSVRITTHYNNVNQSMTADDVITEFTALQKFDFGSNFCTNVTDIDSDVNSTNIIIQNHKHSQKWWVAFNLSNMDLSCGGFIVKVEITDDNHYEGIWITNNYESAQYDLYTFDNTAESFSVPVTVRITKYYNDTNESITSYGVITDFIAYKKFDFGSNFCIQSITNDTNSKSDQTESEPNIRPETSIEISYAYLQWTIIGTFVVIGFFGFIDARCIRKNDFFRLLFIFLAMFQVLDMLSDVFFAVDVLDKYALSTKYSSQFLIIFIASVSFIIIPVIISLYQLHAASHKYWLTDNKTRQWLVTYGAALYLASIVTGSSFGATFIFNSNLFNMNLFDMGLNQKYLLSWNTKKIYSVILFENVPELALNVWYSSIIGQITFIPAIQMIFSVISIVTTVLTICLQKKIYFTQDFVHITIDVKGGCVTSNVHICRRKINGIHQYISESVLGINKNSVDIDKPSNIPNGVQLKMNISYVHDNVNIDPTDHYQDLLQDAEDEGSLQRLIQKEWNLSSVPCIGDIDCWFSKSKEKKQRSIQRKQREGAKEHDEVLPFRKNDSINLAQFTDQ